MASDKEAGRNPNRSRRDSTTEHHGKSRKRARHVLTEAVQQQQTSELFLSALPCASRYSRSLMHRDVLTFVILTPGTNFLLTASSDGHVKFWKKQEESIEFVKNYRAHLGPVVGLSCSADGLLAASISSDGTAKIFDVVNFDLINLLKLGYTPRACCWVHKRGRADTMLAITEEGSNRIRLYDGRGDGRPYLVIDSIHRAPCHMLAYNEVFDCVLSADVSGMVEYWSPTEPYEVPKNRGLWSLKSNTDLFAFKKAKCAPTSMAFSHDYQKIVMLSAADRQIRIFRFQTGKLLKQYDESLQAIERSQQRAIDAGEMRSKIKEEEVAAPSTADDAAQKADTVSTFMLDSMEFGRRLANERELDASAIDAAGDGVRACTGGCAANVVFDESDTYVLYGSLLGVKVRNTLTDCVDVLLGKDETMRFLNVCLFQGIAKKKAVRSLSLVASENPLLAAQKDVLDPTLFCTAFKRSRFYMFTRKEPDSDPASRSGGERDIFNEKPTREEQNLATAASAVQAGSKRSSVASSAVLHTTMGDIHLRLFPDLVGKTVENFVGLSRKGYYNNVIFHRVIKKFMLQTGDPQGDGTGGQSLWGREFEDEFTRQLRHDRPYVLSMANAGPNTNGSQFFLTTVPAPWLDDKHTIFGRATGGFDVIHAIENARINRSTDKPEQDIAILSITLDAT